MTTSPAETVLTYWFGEQRDEPAWLEARRRRWFGGGEAADAEVRERFLALTEEARAGGLQGWEAEPRGLLALLILLDQFSRSLYRGSPEAYRADPAARALVRRAQASGWEARYTPLERVFLYMPLMHSESLEEQQECVRLFEALAQQTRGPTGDAVRGSLDFARRHRDVVQRFGRFPHRNAALGRPTTPEEAAFLQQKPEGF